MMRLLTKVQVNFKATRSDAVQYEPPAAAKPIDNKLLMYSMHGTNLRAEGAKFPLILTSFFSLAFRWV